MTATDPEADEEKKQIRVTESQRDYIHAMQSPGETYADAVARLIETHEDARQND